MLIKHFVLVSFFALTSVSTNIMAQDLPMMSEEEVMSRLKVIDSEVRVKTNELFRRELLAHENVIKEIPKMISAKDEEACKKKRISFCDKIDNTVLQLTENEFEKAGIFRSPNEFGEYFNTTSDEIETLRKRLHNETPSEKYEKAELKVRYVLSKALMHERSTTAFVLASMIVYSARAALDERYVLTIEQLIIEANKQTEILKGQQDYVLNEDISYLE